jgi:hypothetical protein
MSVCGSLETVALCVLPTEKIDVEKGDEDAPYTHRDADRATHDIFGSLLGGKEVTRSDATPRSVHIAYVLESS